MSLIKQLWIAIAVVMTLSFGGSLVVSTLSARHYLEQQLNVKNHDNATSLALSLSQMPKDDVTVELQVAAQFDAGHYRLIRLTDPSGAVIVEREYTDPVTDAPKWFTRLIPINANLGMAQVSDGWNQFGTLTLESHSRYAYKALWDGTKQLLVWFLLGGAATGLIGTLILKHITRPLGRVVEQAEAIGGRRFVTTPEPSTMEFRSVVRAMNALSERVSLMLAEESRRLEHLRRQTQHDDLTGLLNRNQFLNLLESALSREDASSEGMLLVARIGGLLEINRSLGREATDRLLREIADSLTGIATPQAAWEAGRLNASDFALLAPGAKDLEGQAGILGDALHQVLDSASERTGIRLSIGASAYVAGEERPHLLARVDGALAAAELAGDREVKLADPAGTTPAYPDMNAWRTALTTALGSPDGIRLGRYPVMSVGGELMHYEAPVRLRLNGAWQTAGHFMPWANRLAMMPRIDEAVAREALRQIDAEGTPMGINLSSASICDAGFCSELFALLHAAPEQAKQLSIEVPEYDVLHHLTEFRALCLALRPLGCKLGIEHAGPRFSSIEKLHELGLDYLKIDAAIIRGIDGDSGNQAFLRGLSTIAHSIGLLVVAEGVRSDGEKACLTELGVDGMTGPAIDFRTDG